MLLSTDLDCSFFVPTGGEPDLMVYLDEAFNDRTQRTISFFVLYRQSDTVGRLTCARPVGDQDAPPVACQDMDPDAEPNKSTFFRKMIDEAVPQEALFPNHGTVPFNISHGQGQWLCYVREGFAVTDEWMAHLDEVEEGDGFDVLDVVSQRHTVISFQTIANAYPDGWRCVCV